MSVETGIYAINNLVTGDFYIGSCSTKFYKRWSRHRKDLEKGIHSNPKLQNSYNKYGKDSFEYVVLKLCSKEDCIKLEQFYLDNLKPTFNILQIAKSALGHVVSEETKIKIRNTLKGRVRPNDVRIKISKALMGNKNGSHTKGLPKPPVKEETKRKLSASGKLDWIKRKEKMK